ncbi:uncharacterized protein LOC110456272 [Mizuhopecten yessoensis]|uniref:Novel STAND NTPase 3 domain-containing protein n=1 Tax=Mizuhopecten yessoensis TaxID=6573 RepID=A0A210QBC3_MIZYE|nr:uncharacterized protein LOC110456272 [Mizuhopecten yessoensis]OWF46028.1 hypothetical protein KP79_PYT10241 [Mizuhopecten yessoensis]
MGVDLALYRARIGNFVQRKTGQGLSNLEYLLKAIASVRHGLVRSWQCKGTVPFIDLLLLAQGVEPNPGPGVKDQQDPQLASNNEETSSYTGEPVGRHLSREAASSYDVHHNVESSHMRSEVVPSQEQINLERGQLEEMEYGEETTSPKTTLPEENTDSRGYQKGDRIPNIQTITAGASGPEIKHFPVGKMVPAYLQGENTEVTTVAFSQTQGGATGTMVPAHPHGGATGTMVPAYPQGGTTMMQVRKQKIDVNCSFSGGEANVIGDHNAITIIRTDDGAKALMTDVKEILSEIKQTKDRQIVDQMMPQKKSQKTSETQTSAVTKSKENNPRHDQSGEEEKEKEVSAKRMYSEDAAEATITKYMDDYKEVLVERREGIKAVLQRLKDYNMAVITGVTGEGKTTLAAHILKALRDGKLDSAIEAKTPLQMLNPEDWTAVVDANAKEGIVVFVDDLFGTSNYQVDLLNRWKALFREINQCLEKKKVMLLLTSRTHILTDARRDAGVTDDNIDHILSGKKVVDITYKYQLTPEELQNMLGNYSILHKRENDFKYSIPSQTQNRSIGFPQVCSLFFNDPQLYEKGQKFFENPDILLEMVIKKMSKCEPNKYFALVYCFLQQNQRVDSRDLNPLTMPKDEGKMLKVYADVCGVDSNNPTAVLKKALFSLTRTYLSKYDTVYTFSHESVAENVCLVFGSVNPQITLQKCSNRVILELLDLSQADRPTLPCMHVPETCFDVLSLRIYEMLTKGHIISWKPITLASFPRFTNKKFADHFFEYLSKHKLIQEVITVHDNGQSSLLSACANNVAFLSALYRSKVDLDMISQLGALRFTACIQEALLLAIECKNTQSIELLLNQGAVFDTSCLRSALRFQNDQNFMKTVLFGNIWTSSELEESRIFRDPKILQKIRCNVSHRLCNIPPLHTERQQEQTKQTINDAKHGNYFHYMFSELLATAPKSEKRVLLLKLLLEWQGKKLSDVICIRRTLGSLDAALIQHALHRCDADTVRFLVLSTKLTDDQLDTMLLQQVHLGNLTNIEILCKAGGRFSHDDFIKRSGSCGNFVSETVSIMATFGQFSADILSAALKSALRSGTKNTISALRDKGAKYDLDDDTIQKVVCRRDMDVIQTIFEYIDKVHVSIALNAAVHSGLPILVQNLFSRGGKFSEDALIAAVCRTSEVFEMVKIVTTSGKWSGDDFTRALSKAVEICRSDVVSYLHGKGGQFSDVSLLNVLEWNVEHRVQADSIRYMLGAREWSEHQIRTALVECVKKLFVPGGSGKNNWPAFEELMMYNVKHIPVELKDVEKKKIDIIDIIIKVLEKQQRSNHDVLVDILNRSVQHGRMDMAAHLIETGKVCGDDCLVDSVCSEGVQGSDKLKLVRLVRTSRNWSDIVQTHALDKALQCGYEDIVMFLHENGAKFGEESISHAIPVSSQINKSFPLVEYVLRFLDDCRPSHTSLSAALVKTIDCGYYQLMVDLHKLGAKFPDGSLLQIVCKRRKRVKAVEYVCKSRQWPSEERKEALFEAVKFGDLQTTKCIVGIGARFFDKCLTETMEREMKPTHRLCMIKLIISGQNISKEEINRARIKATSRSEVNVNAFLQQLNTV